MNNEQKKGEFRGSFNIKNDVILIGIIGRLVPIKNHKMFLRSAKYFIIKNPDIKVKFVVVGDGELRNDLQEYTHKLELNEYVTFCGWIRDVSLVYSDLDILALTSLNEGTPVSVIEAMASRVPIISTEAGGVVDLVGIGDQQYRSNGFKVCERGVLCRKDDAPRFAQGIKYLLDMKPIDKKLMLDNACAFVREKYTQERLIRNIEEMYHDLMRT